jgi:transposase
MTSATEVESRADLEKRTRRRFSAAEKQRLLAENDALGHGQRGPWLRRQGLYAGQLSTWRRELAQSGSQGLEPKTPGRKLADPRDAQIERLQRDLVRVERRAYIAEQLVELQKKVLQLADQMQDGSTP